MGMGRLLDEFGGLTFQSEAEVSQNFILPLLQKYLGYSLDEIIPERNFPVRELHSGVNVIPGGTKSLNHRPDFVICINGDSDQPRFIIDSKGPRERVGDHLGQIVSYSVSVGTNLLVITNGKELRVYDVNNLLFQAKDLEALQLRFDSLLILLSRESQMKRSLTEIIAGYDYKVAIEELDQEEIDLGVRQKELLLSDFQHYLRKVSDEFEHWHLPSQHFEALNNLTLSQIDPNQLLSFRKHWDDPDRKNKQREVKLHHIEGDRSLRIKVFAGETGSGKSCLLKYLVLQAAKKCLDCSEARIPVFVSLREIGEGYSLEGLIVYSLNSSGYPCLSFHDLPKTNDFVFFLDAYDEIREPYLQDALMAVERLGNRYECYLTTRPNRPPRLAGSMRFDVSLLAEDQVEVLVRRHLDSRYYEFMRQLDQNNLRVEGRNILLLLCLISLFKESGSLPGTVPKVIRNIVGRVRKWMEIKNVDRGRLSWCAIQQILAAFAYKAMDAGETSLQREEMKIELLTQMKELEEDREILTGLSLDNVLTDLQETGLVIVTGDHLYFWHRLFQNYFAAFQLAVIFEKDNSAIRKVVLEGRWHTMIVSLASLLHDVTPLLRQTSDDLWLSAYCLVENNGGDGREIGTLVDRLIAKLMSPVPDVRMRAMNYLANIEREEVKRFCFVAAEGNYAADVRMLALKAIGRTKSKEAMVVIYRHLTWEEPSFIFGPSARAHIARALSYYGEEEHLQIITLWRKTPDFQMAEECKRIFIELHGQGLLTERLLEELRAMLLKEMNAEPSGRDKVGALADILCLDPEEDFVIRVVEQVVRKDEYHNVYAVKELVKPCQFSRVIDRIKQTIIDLPEDSYLAQELVEVLAESEYDVPKEVFIDLTKHPNSNVAWKSIRALNRFPYSAVKVQVEEFLNGRQPQWQGAALEVIVENGEIIPVLKNGKLPVELFSPAAHQLLKGIRLFRLIEGMPVMDRIYKGISDRGHQEAGIHLALELAETYYFLGEAERHASIIGWYFDGEQFLQNDSHIHASLIRELKRFDPNLAVQLAECYYRTYFPFAGDFGYQMNVLLEAIQDLGQQSLVPMVKRIVQFQLDQIKAGDINAQLHLERSMRTLVGLISSSDEEWLLARLGAMPGVRGLEFPELRRAVECLAYCGSANALPYVQQIAMQRRDSPLVLNACQYAYEQICQREKIVSSGLEL